MKPHLRNVLAGLLILLFLGLMAWWVLHVPYRPELMYKPLPRDATVVLAHRDLAGRWDAFSGNPITRSLLGALGMRPEDLADLSTNEESKAWMQKLAGKRVALAFVPHLGPSGKQAWVAASWLGADSQKLRWQMHWADRSVFRKMDPYRGHPCWMVQSTMFEPGTVLTISLVEGMLLACVSGHPLDIRRVLDTYDGYAPSLLASEDFCRAMAPEREPASDDCAWAHAPGLQVPGTNAPASLFLQLDQLQTNRLKASLLAAQTFSALHSATGTTSMRGLDRLWGPLPVAVLAMNKETALALLSGSREPWLRQVHKLVKAQPGETLFLGAFADEYSGRLMGLKVPSLLAAIRCSDSTATLQSIRDALDHVNRSYRWGLIPRPFLAEGRQVHALESTGEGFMSRFTAEESPAYAVCGDWLVFSSNLDVLMKLVARYERVVSTEEAARSPWLAPLSQSEASIQGWLDLERAAKSLRLAISTWSLKLLLEDSSGSQRMRQNLNEAKAWIDAIAPMKAGVFQLTSDAEKTRLSLEMGREP